MATLPLPTQQQLSPTSLSQLQHSAANNNGRRHGALSIIEGYLLKRSETERAFSLNWKRRYFVLTKYGLSYYKQKGGTPIRVIPVTELFGVDIVGEEEVRRKYVFRLRTSMDFVMAATTIQEMDAWMDKLRAVSITSTATGFSQGTMGSSSGMHFNNSMNPNNNNNKMDTFSKNGTADLSSRASPPFINRRKVTDGPYGSFSDEELRTMLRNMDIKERNEIEAIRARYFARIKEVMELIMELEKSSAEGTADKLAYQRQEQKYREIIKSVSRSTSSSSLSSNASSSSLSSSSSYSSAASSSISTSVSASASPSLSSAPISNQNREGPNSRGRAGHQNQQPVQSQPLPYQNPQQHNMQHYHQQQQHHAQQQHHGHNGNHNSAHSNNHHHHHNSHNHNQQHHHHAQNQHFSGNNNRPNFSRRPSEDLLGNNNTGGSSSYLEPHEPSMPPLSNSPSNSLLRSGSISGPSSRGAPTSHQSIMEDSRYSDDSSSSFDDDISNTATLKLGSITIDSSRFSTANTLKIGSFHGPRL